MNIPFPIIYPPMIEPDWFNADRPYDEDAELTLMEQANQQWLNSIAKKYMKPTPLPVLKPNPEPMEEAGSDDDANDDIEESEDSPDIDEEEEITTELTTDTTTTSTTDSMLILNEVEPESPEDNTEAVDLEVESTQWPYDNQNE